AGYTVEGALVSVLEAEHAPLPLVSHALLETWRRRRGTRLTVAGYEETGGVRHALAQSAEAAYLALDEAQQAIARKIFLRLTALGEGTEDTKRRVSRDSLDNDDDTLFVLDHLARARLVTLDDTGVDLTHEAVIRSWPRLSGWLTANRDGLRVHHQLTEATATWESLNRDSGALYRGVRLALAREWAAGDDDAMSTRERRFLTASIEAEEAEQAAARRRTRRLRQLVGLLTVLLLLAVTAVGFAISAQRESTAQRNLAIARKAVSDAQALQGVDAGLSLQLGLAAHGLVDDNETRDQVLSAQSGPYFTRVNAHARDVPALAVTGTLVATVSWDGYARLWDISDTHRPRQLGAVHVDDELVDVDLSRDGRTLAIVMSKVIALYDVSDPTAPAAVGVLDAHTDYASSVRFSPDGTRAVTTHGDGAARLWDVRNVRAPKEAGTLGGHQGLTKRATFSADGRLIAVGAGSEVVLWDVSGDPARRGTLRGHTDLVESIAFSPDGRMIGTGGWDHVARLWDVTDPRAPVAKAELTGSTKIVWGVSFSPDGTTFAATGDNTTRLWDVTGPVQRKLAVVPGGVYAAQFTRDNATLVISEGPKAFRLQNLRDLTLAGHENNVSQLSFRRDGEVLASSSWDGTVWLWRMTAARTREPLARITDGGTPLAGGILRWAEFSPDSTVLATAGDAGIVRLYDVRNPVAPVLLAAFPG
ncbi:MAG TPA: WD40 repeat domain-containing protein, partial [Lentzea sp.]